jgi:hypothetical protein
MLPLNSDFRVIILHKPIYVNNVMSTPFCLLHLRHGYPPEQPTRTY